MYRNLKINRKIKLSSTFIIKSRCKYCQSCPTRYFTGQNVHYKQVRTYLELFDWIKKQTHIGMFYFIAPKQFNIISDFSRKIRFKTYDPSIHHKLGLNKYEVIEYLTCDCGKTLWCYAQKALVNKKEISNRKSDREYPFKIKVY